MLKRILYIFLLLISSKLVTAQCPSVYDYLGNLVAKPYFINCQGTGTYNMNIASNTNWGPYTINWGDGTPNTSGASYTSPALINHVYNSASPDTFVITINIPSLGCTMTGLAVMEKPVNASIQIPIGGVTTACAPKALLFTNSSTDVSETTWFTWNFGDGTPAQTFSYTNSGQTISHTYNKGTVNCQTAVTLTAKNYCTPVPTIANFNPIQIYDLDNAAITPSAFIKCWPDNVFTYTNTTNRNCVPQGNTFQRQERWNLGNYWGLGHDSIINWRPWPPTSPISIAFPSVGTYTVQLMDSNLCGVNTIVQSVTIVNPPSAGLVAPPGPFCQGATVTFTNTSLTGYNYKWNFGTGGGFVTRPFGPQSNTYNTPGTYTVSVVALINGAGAACTDTEKVVINILPRPTANFSLTPNKGCNAITGATFTDLSTGAVSWNWNFGNTNTFNGQNPPPQNYNTIGNFVATLTVTAANTCVHTFTAPLNVYQIPTAAFTTSNACVGSPASFTDNSSHAPGDPITSWNWNFGDASPTATSTVQNPIHTYTAQNTYTIQLVVNTANCTHTVSQTININVKPTADFTLTPLNGCPTLSVNFTNTSSNATIYNWNFGNGNTSSSTDPSSTFTNTGSTNKTYTINLTASTGSGCSDTHSTTVTVFTKPTASFTVNAPTGCSPIAATFTNNSTGATNYNWSFGDMSTSTATTSVLSHTYVNTTLLIQTFTAQLVAISSNGCKDSTSLTVSTYPRPIFNFTMVPNSGCSPLSINFPPVLGAITYKWDFGDGSPADFSPNPTHVFTNTTTADRTYTVQLVAANAFSCVDTTYGYPVVFAKPQANFALTPTVGCSPLPTTFTNTSISGSTYVWKFGDTNTSTSTNTNHTYINTSSTADQVFTCTLVATSVNGCKDSLNKSVLVHFKPFANFALDTPRCASKTITFTNTSQGSSTNSWNFGDSSPLSNVTSPAHTYTNSTINNLTYTVELITTSVFGCKDTANAITTIYAKPIAGAILTPTSGCSPLTVSMNNSGSFAHSYVWKYGDGNSGTGTNSNHTYINTSNTTDQTFTCTLVATNNNGCKDSVTVPVLTFFKPFANFALDTPRCVSKTITFTNTSQGSSTNSWNFGDSSPLSSITSPAHTYTNNTINNLTYTVELITTSASGCKDTANAITTIYAKPIAGAVLTPTSGCSPLAVTMNNSSSFAHTYDWKYGDGNNATTTNTNHIYTNPSNTADQTFTCTLVATNNNGCKDSITVPVLTFFKPFANFTLDTPRCVSKTITFTNTSQGSSTNSWNFGDSSPLSSITSPAHTYTNNTINNLTFTVQLITTSISGCKDTANAITTIYAKPSPSVVITPTAGCSPLTVTMNNFTGFANSYIWKYGDGNSSVSTNTIHTYVNPTNNAHQTYSCTLVATNNNGCQDSIMVPVRVFFKPDAVFTIDTPKCASKTITFLNNTLGATGNTWNFGDFSPTSSVPNPVHTYTNTSSGNLTFTVELIVSTANGCMDTAFAYPEIYAKPIAAFALTPTVSCSPLNATMTNSSLFATSYLWKFGDGNTDVTFNTNHTYINSSNTTNQSFNCTLLALNSNGCQDSIKKTVLVLYNPKANFTVDTPSCSPKLLTFTNTSQGAASYNWDLGSTTSINTNVSHVFTNTTTANVTHTVQLIATALNSCKDTIVIPVIVHPKPEFTIVAQPDSGCSALEVNFPAINNVASYQWNFGDGNISTSDNPANTYYNNSQATKTFTVKLIGIDGYGCSDTSSKVITVFAKPIALFQANPNVVFVPTSPITCSNLSSGAISYYWNFGDGSSSTETNPSYTYQNAGEYQIYLVATNIHGCVDTFNLPSKIIAVLESEIEIPNAFTPNPNGGNGGAFGANDLNNDVFHPVMRGIDKYELNIFSRWGELLFVSKDVTIGWDGYYKGVLCTQDVYVWKITATTLDGKKINKTGDVLLLR